MFLHLVHGAGDGGGGGVPQQVRGAGGIAAGTQLEHNPEFTLKCVLKSIMYNLASFLLHLLINATFVNMAGDGGRAIAEDG